MFKKIRSTLNTIKDLRAALAEAHDLLDRHKCHAAEQQAVITDQKTLISRLQKELAVMQLRPR